MISIFTATSTGSKHRYTRKDDEALIQLFNEGKSREDVAAAIAHPLNSITYRVRIIKAAEAALTKKLAATDEVIESIGQVLDTIKY